MRVLCIAGWSGSGKTTLIVAVLPLLLARGLTVSTIKHAHKGFDMDHPGKDSFHHRQAGAREVLVSSVRRWVLLHENDGLEPRLADLLKALQPVDLVLVEGFKTDPGTKLEVYRPSLGKPPLWPDLPEIAAVASDAKLPDCPRTVLDLRQPTAVADWIARAMPVLPSA